MDICILDQNVWFMIQNIVNSINKLIELEKKYFKNIDKLFEKKNLSIDDIFLIAKDIIYKDNNILSKIYEFNFRLEFYKSFQYKFSLVYLNFLNILNDNIYQYIIEISKLNDSFNFDEYINNNTNVSVSVKNNILKSISNIIQDFKYIEERMYIDSINQLLYKYNKYGENNILSSYNNILNIHKKRIKKINKYEFKLKYYQLFCNIESISYYSLIEFNKKVCKYIECILN